MEAPPDTLDIDGADIKLKLRSYQKEMLEASLARNVIVAMDTGSGKTAVATFRILAELERTGAAKLVWFIAPKVELCKQQHAYISDYLSGYLIKILLGSDGVDKWTDQKLWDATLANVRVVVSTPAVLADAMSHGFVHISRLSLLVFDEAHNCIGKSPMNRIMRDFYHPAKERRESVPCILGLSASPVISAKRNSLQKLEASLDAIAITPKRHRLDLETYVHPPEVASVAYDPPPTYTANQMPCCAALACSIRDYAFSTDPYVIELQDLIEAGDAKALEGCETVQLKRKTWCLEQLSAILTKSTAVKEQLGASAAEWYVLECVRRYLENFVTEPLLLLDLDQKERAHLAFVFKNMPLPEYNGFDSDGQDSSIFAPKVRVLVDSLLQHRSSASRNRIVIFAEQRAVVLALGRALQQNPELAESYVFGTFIGTSTSDRRKTAVADLVDLKAQSKDLTSFRGDGQVNVLVATSVLEEGIDVSACNVVICFDLPKNLVQFVQRRGRARQKRSKYIMFIPANAYHCEAARFARQELEMKAQYMEDGREVALYVEEDEEGRGYRVDSTGALLHFDNAKAHLYHLCQVSTGTSKFVDTRPEFSTEEDREKRWTATVALPSFVHASLRTAESTERWSKEETAIKDASFTAYVALHQAGLVNNNLLPLTQDYGPDPDQTHVDQPSIVPVSETQSSWRRLCQAAEAPDAKWYASSVRLLREDGTEVVTLTIYLPILADFSQSITLYWNQSTRFTVEIQPAKQRTAVHAVNTDLERLRKATDCLLRSVYGSRMRPTPEKLPFFFLDEDLRHTKYQQNGSSEALEALCADQNPTDCGLVRLRGETGRGYFLSSIDRSDNELNDHVAILTAFPKRRDFLHPLSSGEQNAAYTATRTLPLDHCVVESLPAKFALFAAFIPSILHKMGIALLAADLQSSILSAVLIHNQPFLVEAISSPSAREASDYNRLEFLGDAVLKFCATLHVMARHPTWPEGYLTHEKARIVSNNTLAKAALSAELDKYILTKAFTGAKWRPPYVDETLAAEHRTREMSSKVLADVVEALIGAAFVDGGLRKAHDCIRTLLPGEEWMSLSDCITLIVNESAQQKHIELGLLERLVGHKFNKPELLMEALTHASCLHISGSSYERLEFLGDAVLDLIIVPKLFSHNRKPRHWDLHRMRDALVNGDYLAYCSMQHFVEVDRFDVIPDDHNNPAGIQQSQRKVHLHDFLRAGSQLLKAKRECLAQSGPYLEKIQQGLHGDDQYPWPELIAFKPPKFFSDIIESTLGALFLDTAGDISVCEAFVEKLGVFEQMRRILDEHVETAYPKEQVGILADNERVDYVGTSRKETTDGNVVFECTVKIGDEEVASVGGCRSREEAELRAARQAATILESARLEKGGGRKRKLDVAMHRDAAAGA